MFSLNNAKNLATATSNTISRAKNTPQMQSIQKFFANETGSFEIDKVLLKMVDVRVTINHKTDISDGYNEADTNFGWAIINRPIKINIKGDITNQTFERKTPFKKSINAFNGIAGVYSAYSNDYDNATLNKIKTTANQIQTAVSRTQNISNTIQNLASNFDSTVGFQKNTDIVRNILSAIREARQPITFSIYNHGTFVNYVLTDCTTTMLEKYAFEAMELDLTFDEFKIATLSIPEEQLSSLSQRPTNIESKQANPEINQIIRSQGIKQSLPKIPPANQLPRVLDNKSNILD